MGERAYSAVGRVEGPAGQDAGDTPDFVVLRFLGARGRAELATTDPANRLPERRAITWTLNPPSFGRTRGPLTIDNYLIAATKAFDFLAEKYPDAPIWLYGKSIGASCALSRSPRGASPQR